MIAFEITIIVLLAAIVALKIRLYKKGLMIVNKTDYDNI